jgi:hypothetical protein
MAESEIIMRVAKAISGAPFPSAASLRKAKAAIAAMRLPAGASSVAGGLAIEESMFACEDTVFHGAAKCWNAMIDEAISDGQPIPR